MTARHVRMHAGAAACLRCGTRAIKWWVTREDGDEEGVCGSCIRKAERKGAVRA
jgi:hypothetical protein